MILSLLRVLTNSGTHENRDNTKGDLCTIKCMCTTLFKNMFELYTVTHDDNLINKNKNENFYNELVVSF